MFTRGEKATYRTFDPSDLYDRMRRDDNVLVFISEAAGYKMIMEGTDASAAHSYETAERPIVIKWTTESSEN